MKILIIRLSSIGDCVLASPIVAALRERYPDAHITWAVQTKSVSVVRGLPGLDEVLEWDKSKNSLFRALQTAWRGKYDVALDLQGLDKAALFMWASRAKTRITGQSARQIPRRAATICVPEEQRIHARQFYFGRVAPLDTAPDAIERFFPILPTFSPQQEAKATRLLQESGWKVGQRLISLNLGASVLANRWAPENFAALAHALLEEDTTTRIALVGSPTDAVLEEEFQVAFSAFADAEALRSRLVSWVGKTGLLELGCLMRYVHAFVTADTGPMHIAAAMGAPVLALFGPARLWRTAPVQNPDGAPIRVLDASKITGDWPAPMSAHTVEAVLEATREMTSQSLDSPVSMMETYQ